MLYGLNDITIVPAVVSDIESRSECNPYIEPLTDSSKFLPLFSAPMSCIINDSNWEVFDDNGINTIIPRNINLQKRLSLIDETFCAFSLEEFEEIFLDEGALINIDSAFVCIDIANGHMEKLLNLCKRAKEIHGDKLVLMAGNIANPETYLEYAKVGIDYVRCGIGTGNVCTTSSNNGCHMPLASLLMGCVERKLQIQLDIRRNGLTERISFNDFDGYDYIHSTPYKSIPKIIADGGFKNFDQIIKAIALGADYCMLGEIFAKCKEACGEIKKKYPNKKFLTEDEFNNPIKYRNYYGMSTKRAQQELGVTDPEKLKTAEGIEKQVNIDYTLEQWVDNFKHYLRSAMSYTGCRTLEEFSKVRTEVISNQSFNSYYK